MGIIDAILAAVTWAFGDFSIERSSRKIGSVAVLFYISLFASIVFLPFVWRDLHIISAHRELFVISALVFLFSSAFDFLALKVGKISVVEPICAFEVGVTALAAYFIIGERVSGYQGLLIALMILGIFLVSVQRFSHLKNLHAEKGAWLALLATIGMGFANFYFAETARIATPWLINWFAAVFILIFVSLYVFSNRDERRKLAEARGYKGIIFSAMFFDNFSWIFYTYAALYMPISIAVSISESYIALAALLGLIFNKEKLRTHQFFGMSVCILSVVLLSLTLK